MTLLDLLIGVGIAAILFGFFIGLKEGFDHDNED